MSDSPDGKINRPPPTPPPPPTPGTALFIPQDALIGASEEQRRAIAKAELLFAAKVSRAAANSYVEIVRILGGEERKTEEN